MARTTHTDVQRAFDMLVDRMAEMGFDTEHAYLTAWRPDGRGTRYEVGNLPGGAGSFSTVGARNAYDALMFASSVLYAVQYRARDES